METSSPMIPPGLRIWFFQIAGYLACVTKGRGSMYPWYIAQSKVECGPSWTSRAFVDDCNAFGISQGAAIRSDSARVGDTGAGGSGSIATYSPRWVYRLLFVMPGLATMNAYYRNWLDRIEWDERQMVNSSSFVAWSDSVAAHGYKGGANATPQERASYATAIRRQDDDGLSGVLWRMFLVFVVWLLIMVATYVVLKRLWRFLLYGRWKRKKRD